MLSIEEGELSPGPLSVGLFELAIAAIGSLVLLGFLFVAYGIVRSHRAAKRAGLDPFASEAQVIAQAVRGSSLTLEQRLAELDDLHRRGVISTEERAAARQHVLSGA